MKNIAKTKEELLRELSKLRQENTALKDRYEKYIKEKIPLEKECYPAESEPTRSKMKPHSSKKSMVLPPDEQKIRQLFDEYIKMYSSRDDLLTTHFSENFSGFTGGGDFLVKDKSEWIEITRQDFAQVKDPINIEIKDVSIQSLSETIAVTTGFFTINLPIKDHILSKETARLVLIFRKESTGWKITHSSISIPYHLVGEGEIYPLKELVDRNEYLEKLVTERTAQLSEVNDNLKSINEDLAREIAEHKQAEEALRKSEQKYHLLVDKAHEAIVVVQDGFLKLANPMTLTMTGYPAEEVGVIPFQMFIHPEDRALVVDSYKRRLKGEDVPSYYMFRLLSKDGSTRWVYMNGVLIDWEGRPATLNFMNDITELKQAEEALQQSSQKWEAIISVSPDGIGMISLDGKIQLISDKLVKMHGYSSEQMNEFLGRSVYDFIDPSHHKLLMDNTRKLLAGKSDGKLTEYVAIKKDNSRFYIDVNASVLLDSNGHPKSILYVQRDITERKLAEKALQQSNKKLEAIISASPDGIGMVSLDGKMQLMSEKLLEMYGYSKEEKEDFIGKPSFNFIDPSNHEMLMDNIRKLLAGKKDNKLTEYLAIKKDNTRFYIDMNSTVLFDSNGNPESILFVERDITQRKRNESIIQQQYDQLKELNATKDKFFSIIAHDLRSPFQSLLSYSELLATEIENYSHQEIMTFSKVLNNNLINLHNLIENLLQWSMMQRNLLEHKLVNLNLYDLIGKAIEIAYQSSVKKSIIISNNVNIGTLVHADVDMLRSVLHNLIMNAIKFSYKEGRIIISSVTNNGYEEVTIQDFGIGIEQEKASKLFNFNTQDISHGTAGEKGTGLGLSLCKEFIERNGGKIWVESEVGIGSKFKFTLQK